MSELKLPLDFERLPEFWQLGEALRGRLRREVQMSDQQFTGLSVQLWLRLWVVLGYLARSTNRAGWLNRMGEQQVNAAFDQFGDDCQPVDVMNGNLLRKVDDGYQCDLFLKINPPLAGDYVSKEKKGNVRSRLNAGKTVVAATAVTQGSLLPADSFRKRDGTEMDKRTAEAAMRIILTLDRQVSPGYKRHASTYTEGLIADAWHYAGELAADKLDDFYCWLAERREHPLTPKTAEDVLRDWERIYPAFTDSLREGQ